MSYIRDFTVLTLDTRSLPVRVSYGVELKIWPRFYHCSLFTFRSSIKMSTASPNLCAWLSSILDIQCMNIKYMFWIFCRELNIKSIEYCMWCYAFKGPWYNETLLFLVHFVTFLSLLFLLLLCFFIHYLLGKGTTFLTFHCKIHCQDYILAHKGFEYIMI